MPDKATSAASVKGFANAATSGAVPSAKSVWRSTFGHVETDGELPIVEELEHGFVASGHRIQGLLVELVASKPFRLVGEPR